MEWRILCLFRRQKEYTPNTYTHKHTPKIVKTVSDGIHCYSENGGDCMGLCGVFAGADFQHLKYSDLHAYIIEIILNPSISLKKLKADP